MALVEYIVCPICGRNRVTKRRKKGMVGWPDGVPFDLATTILLQVREGGGRGSGFHLVEDESLTLPQMIEQGGYEDLLEGMKQQLLRVIRQGIDLGFIERNEI